MISCNNIEIFFTCFSPPFYGGSAYGDDETGHGSLSYNEVVVVALRLIKKVISLEDIER